MSDSIRQEAIRRIASQLKERDSIYGHRAKMLSSSRLKVGVMLGSEDEYMEDAAFLLDAEVIRLAEESVMKRLRDAL